MAWTFYGAMARLELVSGDHDKPGPQSIDGNKISLELEAGEGQLLLLQ